MENIKERCGFERFKDSTVTKDIDHSILKLPCGWKSSFQSGDREGKDREASCLRWNKAPFCRTLEGDHLAGKKNEESKSSIPASFFLFIMVLCEFRGLSLLSTGNLPKKEREWRTEERL